MEPGKAARNRRKRKIDHQNERRAERGEYDA